MGNMEIRVSKAEGKVPVSVIHVTGDVAAENCGILDARAGDVLHEGSRHIIVDLTECKYMSSAGFRVLHKIYNALHDDKDDTAQLRLVKPPDEVSRILKVMGFDVVMEIHDDLASAVAAF